MTNYTTTTTEVTVHQVGENPIFSEGATRIHLDDEAGGFFFILEQSREDTEGLQRIRVDPEELELIAESARTMLQSAEQQLNPHGRLPGVPQDPDDLQARHELTTQDPHSG
jgi:hypothetical protein